jgi:thiosulfate dehydrogenase (quinone) large subunit
MLIGDSERSSLYMDKLSNRNLRREVERLEDPPVAKALFGDVRWAWLWLILRVYLGWIWLTSGLNKLGSPAWTGENAGAAITGFVQGALELAGGERPAVQGWYAWFLETVVLPNARLWSFMVTFGEVLVGIGLIVGVFTGIAAFFGSIMNASYLLAGTVGVNPVMFAIATLLVLAWKIAGWWGLDRWILPALGTPWSPGLVFHHTAEREPTQAEAAPPASRSYQEIPSTGREEEDRGDISIEDEEEQV